MYKELCCGEGRPLRGCLHKVCGAAAPKSAPCTPALSLRSEKQKGERGDSSWNHEDLSSQANFRACTFCSPFKKGALSDLFFVLFLFFLMRYPNRGSDRGCLGRHVVQSRLVVNWWVEISTLIVSDRCPVLGSLYIRQIWRLDLDPQSRKFSVRGFFFLDFIILR